MEHKHALSNQTEKKPSGYKGKLNFFYFPRYHKKDRIYYLIILLALMRPVGFALRSPLLEGVGAASCISPLPTVFSSPGNIEAFTSDFSIAYKVVDQAYDTIQITPILFNKLEYPNSYRNAISLIFGYFPLLPEETAESGLQFLFFKENILQTMGIPSSEAYTLINSNEAGTTTSVWKINVTKNEE